MGSSIKKERPQNKVAGFTLIELMIVIVIVAVLVSIALPSYNRYVVRSYRNTAQSDLMGFAQAMEKQYALNFTYEAAGAIYPDESPLDGDDKRYDLDIIVTELSTTTFLLEALPKVGGTQENDGRLRINHLGQRWWDKDGDGDPNEPGERDWNRR